MSNAPERTTSWDEAAAGWNHHSNLIHQWLQDITQTMLDDARIAKGMRVLDVAAGAGDQTLDIARRVGPRGRVLATDLSPGILALAQANAAAAGLAQVSTQVADAQALGLAGAGFDAAVCRLGLMFCCSPLMALNSIRMALRPNGRFSALVFGPPEGNPCLTIAFAAVRKHLCLADAETGRFGNPDDAGALMSLGKPGLLHELLIDAGFADVAVHSVPAPFFASSAAHYVDFLRSSASPLMALLMPLAKSEQQAAWCDMTEQLRKFDVPGGWRGPNQLLRCTAVSPA